MRRRPRNARIACPSSNCICAAVPKVPMKCNSGVIQCKRMPTLRRIYDGRAARRKADITPTYARDCAEIP